MSIIMKPRMCERIAMKSDRMCAHLRAKRILRLREKAENRLHLFALQLREDRVEVARLGNPELELHQRVRVEARIEHGVRVGAQHLGAKSAKAEKM